MPGPLLIAASWFPPSVGGSSVLSRNLWAAWPSGELAVVSYNPPGRKDPALCLPDIPVELIEPWPFKDERSSAQLEPLAAGAVRQALLRAAARLKPAAIWANWPNTSFAIGAWLAARKLRLPFFLHLHDTWQESFHGRRRPVESAAAALLERRILRSATRLFTITDAARDHYRAKHNVDSFVLDHTVPDADLLQASAASAPPARDPAVIHFAGSIYGLMNQDAVVNLVRALALCRNSVVFECFTPNDARDLAAIGIGGDRVRIRFGSKADVMSAQRQSAMVFMPLAFQSSNPLEIRTVFPTKLLEYYICGRPILVHAPPDAWVCGDARRHGWGVVADTPDPVRLAAAIDGVLDDASGQQRLVDAAREAASRRAASRVAAALRQEILTYCSL